MTEPEGIAVVGMACRFPGADTPTAFHRNLVNGVDALEGPDAWPETTSLREPTAATDADRARRVGLLRDVDRWDATYFGLTPAEAAIMDPQQRLFLEASAEALQRAGHDRDAHDALVGVFAGAGVNTYFMHHVLGNRRVMEASAFQAIASNEKDFIATQVAHRLNLTGPAVSLQTACSTSLVATASACESLESHQCDVALAGGASVKADPAFGFFLAEGGIESADGACRAFDARANGTTGGMGVGVVVLKRLADALRDGDVVHAVVKGWAVNNDGNAKAGYTAPSVDGQARVIAEALAMADAGAHTIGFVEAHGTGTPVGDPIEVDALTRVYRQDTDRTGTTALGSVKTNIGHLDAAAGVAGLMKAVLALEHEEIPPSLHFTDPNPALRLHETPFHVNTRPLPWPRSPDAPRRAAVSSFGIGGTNAHVVLEEAPPRAPREDAPDAGPHVLPVSARTATALDAASRALADHVDAHPDARLGDVAFTLQTGRRRFKHRRAVVASTREDAAAALRGNAPRRVLESVTDARDRDVAFLFPGQGAQYVNMGRELYEREPVFRDAVDACARHLHPHLGVDVRELLYPDAGGESAATDKLKETAFTQPAVFVVEYALAELLHAWGVTPCASLGHSIGEYVAACRAGVLTLEDALRVVATRSRLMQEADEGAMLAVSLPEKDAEARAQDAGVTVAAVNAPDATVLSGPVDAVAALEAALTADGVPARRLHVTRAFHSPMMDTARAAFKDTLRDVPFRTPDAPWVSNVTGTWITPEEATDPAYWARHLREPVRFADGVATLLADTDAVLLEVGPGRTLASLATRHPDRAPATPVVTTLPHPGDAATSSAHVTRSALARLWLAGAHVDWRTVHAPRTPRRVELPPYPWEKASHWLPRVGLAGGTPDADPHVDASAAAAPADDAAPGSAAHARPDLPTPYVAPETALQEALVGVWEDLFGFEGIGVHDDFFDLGGHSLLATRVVTRLRETFDVDVALQDVFEARTVADLEKTMERVMLEKLDRMTDEEAEDALGRKG